jgi:hypothetical protein
MVIDDVGRRSASTVLPGNFSDATGMVLTDNPALAAPAGGWSRGGSDGSVDQVTTVTPSARTPSCCWITTKPVTANGSMFLTLSPFGVADNDVLVAMVPNLQFDQREHAAEFRVYRSTGGTLGTPISTGR